MTRQALRTFVRAARRRMRPETGGYRRGHLRVLAQRVEVDAEKVFEDIDSVLLVHAPPFCSWHAHDGIGRLRQSVAPVENSTEYYPKARGEYSFKNFEEGETAAN